MKTKGIIYKITNNINGKVYIGKTVQQFERRVQPHKYKSCTALNNSIQKHGWDNFTKEVIATVLNEQDIASTEEYFIKYYDCLAPKGYNIIEIDNGLNRYSQETKDKISESRKEYYSNKTTVNEAPNKKEHIFINNVEHKECGTCKEVKSLLSFNKSSSRWDGLHFCCKTCHYKRRKVQTLRDKLSEEDFKQSYVDRRENMREGLKKLYSDKPELRAKQAQRKSKAIIGTHVETGIEIEFPSALAANEYGFNNSNLGEAIKKNKVYKKHMWKFK